MTKAKTKAKKAVRKAAKAMDDESHLVDATTAFLKENAVPLTMVAVGAGLMANRAIANGHNGIEEQAEKAANGLSRAGEKVKEVSREAARIAGERSDALSGTIREHPFMAGIAALAIGAGVAAVSMQRSNGHIGR